MYVLSTSLALIVKLIRVEAKQQLGECIGKGQFGTVYRALNLNTGQVVAVKRIQLEGKTEAEIEQLSNEVSLLQRLNHPAIVRYQGLLRSENYLNIVLEYGRPFLLSHIIQRRS